jgi:hypothetical protein
MKLLVEPIYGWGWTDLHGQSVEVPAPFELDVSVLKEGRPFYAAGGRLGDDIHHPLRSLWILLSQRHTVNDGHYNLTASDVELDLTEPFSNVAKVGFAGYAMARES